MKIIIDTDVGVDDAVALLMITAHKESHILAMTIVAGNVPLAQAAHNAGVILNVAQAPAIPVYQGCVRPLMQGEAQNATDVHGVDGLGGISSSRPGRAIQAEHASLALLRLSRQFPGQLTLLALGPLTNIALAIRLDPAFLQRLGRLVIMGGAVKGHGNTTPPAEFNIAVDPEAAKIVFQACSRAQMKAQLVSWEATLANAIPGPDWHQLIAGRSAVATLMQALTHHIVQRSGADTPPFFLWPDPLAAAVALAPDIITDQEPRFVDVECGHNLARGQTIVDYRLRSTTKPNADIIKKVHIEKFQKLLAQAVQQEGG